VSSAIHHLASSRNGAVLAAAEFERTVHIYNIETLKHLRTFDTTMDFGGTRLAISEDGLTLVAGAYHVHGIAAYSIDDGVELWRRKNLKKVQRIKFSADDSSVICCFDSHACENLHRLTGKSGQTLRGVRRIWESPFAPIHYIETAKGYALINQKARIASIPRVSRAALGVAFSQSNVCLAEAGGPVRCFDITNGNEIWRHVMPKGTHVLRIAFCESRKGFVGVSWPFEKGGRLLLHFFSPQSGKSEIVHDVGTDTAVAFCLRGSRLMTRDGSLFDVSSGRIVGKLPFPPAKPSVVM
jgi:WD40 repeat protein